MPDFDDSKVNILLVDDQPAKLLAYEVILDSLGEHLLQAHSGREALAILLKTDIAVALIDVNIPELDGFQLAAMIREHPRFAQTAIIFVSAIHLTDLDRIRGYEMGAVDYVPVPVMPEVLRAKVRIFVDLYRKTRRLERMNAELERRVRERTAELEAATERQTFLAREVDHRAKNALAVVQSIVRLTQASDIGSYVEAVEGRIQALSRAHSLLSDSRWDGAHLERIISDELDPYRTRDPRRLSVSGPAMVLKPAAAQALALAIHELATNAAKHGALAAKDGQVGIHWQVAPDALVIEWKESNGLPIEPPTSKGFGTKLIKVSIEQQLGGSADFDWRADGLRCVITLPRNAHLEKPANAKPPGDGHRPAEPAPDDASERRVLLVEDDAVIAMMMADHLEELGFRVVGPFARLKDALAGIDAHRFDAAVLDINLNGELVYPLAEQLLNREVPFIFVSGYHAEMLDTRFRGASLLRKPIEKGDLQRALAGFWK